MYTKSHRPYTLAWIALFLWGVMPTGFSEEPAMFWTGSTGTIHRADLNGRNIQDLMQGDARGVAVDPVALKMYWTDGTQKLLKRSDLDGSRVQVILATETSPRDIVLDPVEGKMYWYNGHDATPLASVRRADLDGSNVEVLTTSGGFGYIGGFDIDTNARKLYEVYSSDSGLGSVSRYDLDGSNGETLIFPVVFPGRIALDLEAGHLYFVEFFKGGSRRLMRADLDGQNLTEVISTGVYDLAIDAEGGKIYWTEQSGRMIRRANLNGSMIEDLVDTNPEFPHDIILALDLLPSDLQCRVGSVNADFGLVRDTLYMNGTIGDESRSADVGVGELFWGAMLAPPGGGSGQYVVHANFGEPSLGTVTVLPSHLGSVCFPLLVSAGATPAAIWNGVGREEHVGESRYFDGSPLQDPSPGPSVFLQLSQGDLIELSVGTTVTFQGVIKDPVALSPKKASATNAVIVNVL